MPQYQLEPLLKRIASERMFLLSSGGSDWIAGSGKAEKIEGGYRIAARKIFASGAPTAHLAHARRARHRFARRSDRGASYPRRRWRLDARSANGTRSSRS
jgi:alkylation response protein AidB-like acyl-CoA dehydrogenase